VSLTVSDGLVYGVGGGKAVVIDPVNKTVVAAVPVSGSLPGTTGTGTTKANVNLAHLGRVYRAGIEGEANILYYSAVGEALTLDTGELAEGHAGAIGVGRDQQVTDAIVALAVASSNAMIVGCVNSIYALLGDPADGGAQLVPVSLTTGCSGPNAITTAAEGVTIVASPEGLHIVQVGADPLPLSRKVLTTFIQYPRGDRANYKVTVVRDPARHVLHVFLTNTTIAASACTHLAYDERTGNYDPAGGGFFPERYPIAPTCACIWKGRPVIGTADGYIVEFHDSPTVNDLGTTAIDGYFSLTLVDEAPFDNDTILDYAYVLLGSNPSDNTFGGNPTATMTVYGGRTPEDAYDVSARWTLGTYTVNATPTRTYVRKRGPALLLVLRNNNAGQNLVFEAMEVTTMTGRPVSRAGWKAALAVGAPCAVPVGSTGSPAGSGASAISGPGLRSIPVGGSAGSKSQGGVETGVGLIYAM